MITDAVSTDGVSAGVLYLGVERRAGRGNSAITEFIGDSRRPGAGR